MRIFLVIFLLWATSIGSSSDGVELIDEHVEKETYCLAQNIYFEASTQPTAGKIAVGLVVLNRLGDTRYPNTVCDVVYEGPVVESWKTQAKDIPDEERIYIPIRHMCQFSWYCDGKSDQTQEHENWYKSQSIAVQLMEGRYKGLVEGATHYHATWVRPSWAKSLTYIGQIGDHLFYKWENK